MPFAAARMAVGWADSPCTFPPAFLFLIQISWMLAFRRQRAGY